MIKTIDAIMAINPNAKVRVFEKDGVKQIEWLENTTPISEADINVKITELQNSENSLKDTAKAKLIAGEALTEEEANLMLGG